jgi:hypothetical protein
MTAQIRPIRPSGYRPVISVINDWWDGRRMADMLPRLFFEHFTCTSFAAERNGELAGFNIEPGDTEVNGVPVTSGYHGDGHDPVRFVKNLAASISTRPALASGLPQCR